MKTTDFPPLLLPHPRSLKKDVKRRVTEDLTWMMSQETRWVTIPPKAEQCENSNQASDRLNQLTRGNGKQDAMWEKS